MRNSHSATRSTGCCPRSARIELAAGAADIGLVPIAALATTPACAFCPDAPSPRKAACARCCWCAAPTSRLNKLRSVAADTASRTTLAYARILFHKWGNPDVPFLPMAADLDAMLDTRRRRNRDRRSGADGSRRARQPIRAHRRRARLSRPGRRMAHAHRPSLRLRRLGCSQHWQQPLDESIAKDFIRSRDHGLQNIDALVAAMVAPAAALGRNDPLIPDDEIHYVLDEECMEGMRGFFRMAARRRVAGV